MTTTTKTAPAAPKIMPEVGMGATYGIGSDSYPFTIISVANDRAGNSVIEIRRCDYQATADSNYYGHQSYTYSERVDAPTETWRWDAKNERWRRVHLSESGRMVWSGPVRGVGYLHIGERRAKQDPHY